MVMVDANFRLKCKDRNIQDIALGAGLSYFVDEAGYKSYIEECGPQTEVVQ